MRMPKMLSPRFFTHSFFWSTWSMQHWHRSRPHSPTITNTILFLIPSHSMSLTETAGTEHILALDFSDLHQITDVVVDLHCLNLFRVATKDLLAQRLEGTESGTDLFLHFVDEIRFVLLEGGLWCLNSGGAESDLATCFSWINSVEHLLDGLLELLNKHLTRFELESLADVIEVGSHSCHPS